MKIINLLLFLTTSQNLLLSTEEQQKQFLQNEIPYKMYPLLQYPFGRKLYGFLHYEKTNGCSKIKITSSHKPREFPYFLLLEDMDCNFHLKAINAQNSKAELLIIITDKGIDKKNMDNNNSFYSISAKLHIPVLLVDLKTGGKLKKMLENSGDFAVEFTTPLPNDNFVRVEFYVNSDDHVFVSFLYGLKGIFSKFEEHLKLKFFLFKSGDEKKDKEMAEFQILMNCMDTDVFVTHIMSFKYCIDLEKKLTIADCYLENVKLTNILEYNKAIKCKMDKMKDVFVIEEEMPMINKIKRHSSIFINDSVFLGPFDRSHFVNSICSNFEISPVNCIFQDNKYVVTHDYVKKNKKEIYVKKKKIYVINIIVFILLMLFAGSCLFGLFRKIYQQKLRDNVEKIVEKSVKDYYAKNKSLVINN